MKNSSFLKELNSKNCNWQVASNDIHQPSYYYPS